MDFTASKVIILILAYTSSVEAGTIFINTVKQSSYNRYTSLRSFDYFLHNSTSFTAQVKACSNAHIALLEENGDVIYEIFIGGYTNTMSAIRKFQKPRPFLSEHAEWGLISCTEFRTFRVNWTSGFIQVERANDETWQVFLSLNEAVDVADVGVSTSMYDTGMWRIPTEDNKITFATASESKYIENDFTIGNNTDLIFEVKSCVPVNVSAQDDNDVHFRVMVDVASNKASLQTRGFALHGELFGEFDSSCSSFTLFWIRWKTELSVSRPEGCDMNTINSRQKSESVPIRAVWVSTTSGIAIWKLHENDEALQKSVCTKDTIPALEEKQESSSEISTLYSTTSVEGTEAMTNENGCCRIICKNVSDIIQHAELSKLVTQLQEELKVSKQKTSQYIRKLISAPDKRQSAATIGYFGAVIIAFVFIGIIAMDLPALKQMFCRIRRNIVQT